MVYIGIDPGQSGGIAVIEDNTAVAYRYTSEKLIEIIQQVMSSNKDLHVFVEDVHAMPGQGVTSMFTFGKGFGIILGVLEAMDVSYTLLRPQKWKRIMQVTADKKSSIKRAQQLFPETSLLPTSRCRVPSDGMAESLLIAQCGIILTSKEVKESRGKINENWKS